MSEIIVEDMIAPDKLIFFDTLFANGPVDHRGDVPYYWCPWSTSNKFPQFSHILMERESGPCSPWFEFFREIVYDFLDKNQLPYGAPVRGCLNLTYHVPGYKHTDPHIDYFGKHYVILLYLNDADGNTVIFDEEYSEGREPKYDVDTSDFKIKYESIPKKGKIVCFDGKYYHALVPTSPGNIRNVCVFNVLC